MDLKNLAKSMDYKWRVQSFSKNKASASCVAYIDARQVQDRLDEVCGSENWQNDYYIVGGLLFCKIGIKIGDEWVWKGDTGSESNIEKEKGHVSDAFKRAAVHWSIGRFLYEMEIKHVTANEKKTQSNYPYVVDNFGKRVWNLTKHIRNINKSPKSEQRSDPKSTTPSADTSQPTPADQANRVVKLMNAEETAIDLLKRYNGNKKLIESLPKNLQDEMSRCYWARKKIIEKQEAVPPKPKSNPVSEQPPPQNEEEIPPPGEDNLPPEFDEEPTPRLKAIRDTKAFFDGATKEQLPSFMDSLKTQLDKMPLEDQSEIRAYYDKLIEK